jgi:signal transduction histidine kinase
MLPSEHVDLPRWFWSERLLMRAGVLIALLIVFQLAVTLLYPPWISPESDWGRSTLAWPELLIVVWVSRQLSRNHQPSALAWWMWSAALLCNLVGQTLWSVDDQLVFHHGVPFPSWPDLFYLLQYPFFFLGVALLPHTSRLAPRLLLVVDGLLVMGAANALSWYFILAPMYAMGGMSAMTRTASLAYPVGDLFVLYGLTLTLLRPSRYGADRLVLGILIVAVGCLIVADTLAVLQVIYGFHVYRTGSVSDVLWDTFYLLVALAALVQLRLAVCTPSEDRDMAGAGRGDRDDRALHRQEVLAGLRLFLPILAALLASGVILICATIRVVSGKAPGGWMGVIVPFQVSFGLLLLVIVRQGITFVDNVRLRREMEVVRANEEAQRELNRRKDAFLEIVGHELKTPLTSLQGYLHLAAHGSNGARRQQGGEDGHDGHNGHDDRIRRAILYAQESVSRLICLVNDILDESWVHHGQLTLHLEPCELDNLMRTTVEEQQVVHADRHIALSLPPARVLVLVDAQRIQEVLTNYLTNALKYSGAFQPVEVTLEVEAEVARVAVRDLGPGVPAWEQARIWDLYYRSEGTKVHYGSRVGLGIGLYLSKTFIEAHQGKVGIDSTVGKGSTFWFTLPLAHDPVANPGPKPMAPEHSETM